MQVETLASVVVVVGFFAQRGWVLGLVSLSLPPSLPAAPFSFASPCLHLHVTRFLGERARVAPLHPIASGQGGMQAGGPSAGATSWGGAVAPASRLRGALERNLSTQSVLFLLRRARSRELLVSTPGSIRTGGQPGQQQSALAFY